MTKIPFVSKEKVEEIAAKYPRIAEMMQSRYLTINSTHYRNYPEFKEDLAAALARIIAA